MYMLWILCVFGQHLLPNFIANLIYFRLQSVNGLPLSTDCCKPCHRRHCSCITGIRRGASGRGPSFSMPMMTANTAGGFTVSASTLSSNAFQAFDSSSSTNWTSGSTYSLGAYTGTVTTGSTMGEYLQIQTPVLCQLQSYSLYGSSQNALNAFSIMGSLDGFTYTTIDTRSGQNCMTQ